MPRIKRISRRNRSEYTELHVRDLLHGHSFFGRFGRDDDPTTIDRKRDAWNDLRETLLPEFIEAHPGQRPWAWWRFDAPEPRRQVLTNEQAGWEAFGEADYWGMPHKFVPLGPGAGLSPPLGRDDDDREPMFETQLAYLKRLRLLTAEEREALKLRRLGIKPTSPATTGES